MRLRAAAIGAGVLLLATGCRFGDLAFRTDERVEIVSPEDRATVQLPFELRWTVEDFDGSFAVLLDESPMPPGEGLAYFARDDDSCRADAGCPDETYLADRGVHTTNQTSFRVTTLSDTRPSDRPSAPDDHEITIVLLDGRGERIGESAFRVTVIVDRGRP